jgi:tetratricopeptide (TPR) repeat protein
MAEGKTSGSFRQVRIDTWKSIARYLGRSSRTVQRWHREYGLPVRRLGVESGSIFAYADELDRWLRDRDRSRQSSLFDFIEQGKPRTDRVQAKPDWRQAVFDSPCIPGSQRQRSMALVAFANKLWATASNENLKMIAKCFREAIDLDPGNAAAFAGLSHALIAQSLMGILRIPSAYVAAKAALDRAMEIDAALADAKCALAWLKILLDRDWHGARRLLDDLQGQQISGSRDLLGRALLHIAQGSPTQASGLLQEALQQVPLNVEAAALYCWSEYLAENYGNALDLVEETRASGQTCPLLEAIEALASIHCEKAEASIPRIETLLVDSPRHELLMGVLGHALALNGQIHKANEILNAMTRPVTGKESASTYAVALILLGLNEKHDAVQWLEQSYRNGSLWSLGFASDPVLRSLRDEAVYRAFLSANGYPVTRPHGPMREDSPAAIEALQASAQAAFRRSG